MWVEGSSDWLDSVSKSWPIIVSVIGFLGYLVGTMVRSRVNDKELVAVTKAVSKIESVVAELVSQKVVAHGHIEQLTVKLGMAFREIRELRAKADKNAADIANIRGRMSR